MECTLGFSAKDTTGSPVLEKECLSLSPTGLGNGGLLLLPTCQLNASPLLGLQPSSFSTQGSWHMPAGTSSMRQSAVLGPPLPENALALTTNRSVGLPPQHSCVGLPGLLRSGGGVIFSPTCLSLTSGLVPHSHLSFTNLCRTAPSVQMSAVGFTPLTSSYGSRSLLQERRQQWLAEMLPPHPPQAQSSRALVRPRPLEPQPLPCPGMGQAAAHLPSMSRLCPNSNGRVAVQVQEEPGSWQPEEQRGRGVEGAEGRREQGKEFHCKLIQGREGEQQRVGLVPGAHAKPPVLQARQSPKRDCQGVKLHSAAHTTVSPGLSQQHSTSAAQPLCCTAQGQGACHSNERSAGKRALESVDLNFPYIEGEEEEKVQPKEGRIFAEGCFAPSRVLSPHGSKRLKERSCGGPDPSLVSSHTAPPIESQTLLGFSLPGGLPAVPVKPTQKQSGGEPAKQRTKGDSSLVRQTLQEFPLCAQLPSKASPPTQQLADTQAGPRERTGAELGLGSTERGAEDTATEDVGRGRFQGGTGICNREGAQERSDEDGMSTAVGSGESAAEQATANSKGIFAQVEQGDKTGVKPRIGPEGSSWSAGVQNTPTTLKFWLRECFLAAKKTNNMGIAPPACAHNATAYTPKACAHNIDSCNQGPQASNCKTLTCTQKMRSFRPKAGGCPNANRKNDRRTSKEGRIAFAPRSQWARELVSKFDEGKI